MPVPLLRRAAAAVVLSLLTAAPAHAAELPAGAQSGDVLSAVPLDRARWIPGTTARALKLTYVTTDAHGRPTQSTGELFLPKGPAPRGGWPVVSWAHGTSGLGDACAPSNAGPALPERDFPYLANWMKEGYAIVASDYYGLGTPGLPAYLHGRSEAHNIVDIVKAARAYGAAHLRATDRVSRRWVTIGQSQGGGAAIYTARHATAYGGSALDYLGAVGTGTPAYIEDAVSTLGPGVPPVALPAGLTAYLAYILASLRDVHPELGIDGILTAEGRKYLGLAEEQCVEPFEKTLAGVNAGAWLTRPLASLPKWSPTITDYMAMPETGFDKPFFMGHGLVDTDVPFALTAPYVAKLQATGQPLTFKSYPSDHSGTLLASQADTHPFVRRLFGPAGPASELAPALAVPHPPALAAALRGGLRVRATDIAAGVVRITARRAGTTVASGRAVVRGNGSATVRLRFTSRARRALASARRVTLRLTGGGVSTTVTLRR